MGRLGVSWLDVKLGLRMIFRHPGLTAVALFALSIGIPASLMPIHIMEAVGSGLPFAEAGGVVGIRNRDLADGGSQIRSLHDFFIWRDELSTFEAVAAARTDPLNVISDDGQAAPIRGSEITAAAFRILRVPPLLGRTLVEEDEVPGAPDVVLLSHNTWQTRLGGDPDVVGTTIRIGTTRHEIVGVMPEGFLFPMRDELWLPLRDQPTEYERGMGPDIITFGRLAPGASLGDAEAELSTVGARIAAEFPETNEFLRPQVMEYTAMIAGIDPSERVEIYFIQLIAFMLLAVVCGNVGTLILARTSTRTGEIAIRTALGASRSRIIGQLFVEALVLAVAAAGVGLFLGDLVANAFQREAFLEAPFWFDLGVKPRTVAVTLSVAVFCAVVAGVVPAVKATGPRVQRSLQGARAGSSMRFGGVSSVLIVAEVALAVAFLTAAGTLSQGLLADARVESEIETDEYQMSLVRIPWTDHSAFENDLRVDEFKADVVAAHEALLRQLQAEPGVRGVAMGSGLPGMEHPGRRIEVDGEDQGEEFQGHVVRFARVDVGFFDGLGASIHAGRDFNTGDLAGTLQAGRTSVIVNTDFVDNVLGGRNPLGQRFRYRVPDDQEPGQWYEIIGVVGHLGMNDGDPLADQGLDHPGSPGELHPIWTAVHVGADPMAFTPRLREITALVDPQAMIQYPAAMDKAPNGEKQAVTYGSLILFFLSGIALLLSGAGLYALMSFTVTQRRREIGVRTALGARSGNVFLAVARRAFVQLVVGTALGVGLGYLFVTELVGNRSDFGTDPMVILATCALFMFIVGLLACIAPTLRALGIKPVEALKEA